jgi:hypothetical protein
VFLVEPSNQSYRELWSENSGLGVSMRFLGPEEGGVAAISRTPGPSLVGIIAAGALPLDAASPLKGGGKGAEGSGKGGTVAHKWVGSPQGPH